MKSTLFTSILIILGTNCTQAQTLSPFVISSSGAFYSNATGMLSSTIGEMSMVSTFSSGNSILTQGFQQAFDFVNSVQALPAADGFSVYPNPTPGNIYIQVPGKISGDLEANVYDMLGRTIFKKMNFSILSKEVISLSLANLSNGFYLVELKSADRNYLSKINVIK